MHHPFYKPWLVLALVFLLLILPGCKASHEVIDGQEPLEGGSPGDHDDLGEEEDDGDSGGQQEEENQFKQDSQLVVTGDSLAVRKTPGTKDKGTEDVLVRLKRDQKVFLQDKHDNQIEMDGYVWWEIYDPNSQVKGWCAAKHLKSIDEQSMGTIEGSITFPSDNIPDGLTVVVEDVVTGQEYTTDQILYDRKYRFGVGFIIQVPPGSYYVYAIEPDFSDFKAYYDEHMRSNFEVDSYEKIVVPLMEGQHVDDVIVGNWWREGYPS